MACGVEAVPVLAANVSCRMYAVMEKWRQTVIAPEDWPSLKAIAATSHMARRASMYSQVTDDDDV